MPIMQAFFSSLGRSELIRYIPSSVSLSTSLFGTVALPLPATLSSPPSFVHHPHHRLGKGEMGRQRHDTLFVSQERMCQEELRCQTRCQTKSHLVQELQDKLLVCPPFEVPPRAMVLPSTLCLLHPNPSPIFLITKVSGIQKNLLTNCFLVYFPSTFPPSELKGDKSKEPLRLCGCVYAKGEAEGTHRANKTRFPLGPNLIIFCCRCQADGAAWFLI